MLKDLRNLYINEEKRNAIFELLTKYNTNLEKQMTLNEEDEEEQDPTAQLWLYYYLANHHFYTGEYKKAFEFIDKAIEHSPTVVELYTLKGKIYKHAGDKEKAYRFYNEGRMLDTADRFLNARTARYQMQLDQIEEMEKLIFPFSKDGDELNIHDMQQLWYECRVGESYLRQENTRLALKNFNFVKEHLQTIYEDQFDFHFYAMRKFSLVQYFDMINFCDKLYAYKYASQGAIGVMRTLNRL